MSSKITIKSLHADNKRIYPKYRYISKQVATRLCNDLELLKDLPRLGYEKSIGYVGKDVVILQNFAGR